VPGIDQADLRRALVDRYGVSPPLGSAADMTRILSDALHERGYLNATITPRPVLEHSPERATLVFTIDPGPRTTIGESRFSVCPRSAGRNSSRALVWPAALRTSRTR
jgi:Outer membrane protein/protective antigen OMA87